MITRVLLLYMVCVVIKLIRLPPMSVLDNSSEPATIVPVPWCRVAHDRQSRVSAGRVHVLTFLFQTNRIGKSRQLNLAQVAADAVAENAADQAVVADDEAAQDARRGAILPRDGQRRVNWWRDRKPAKNRD